MKTYDKKNILKCNSRIYTKCIKTICDEHCNHRFAGGITNYLGIIGRKFRRVDFENGIAGLMAGGVN